MPSSDLALTQKAARAENGITDSSISHTTTATHQTPGALNTPTDRKRMIFGSKRLIAKLVATEPTAAPSISDVLGSEAVGGATHLKNTSSVMDESGVQVPSIRPLTCPGFTVCATHPLLLSDGTGKTVRCLNSREQAKLMIFPDIWKLPAKSRDAVHAVGNAIPPAFSRKVTELAIEVLQEMDR